MDHDIQQPIDPGTIPSFAPNDGEMVYMSVVEDGASIAFAAYNEKSNEIILEKCVADGYEIETIAQRVLSEINPTLALLSSKTINNESLLNLITIVPEKFIVHLIDGVEDGADLVNDNPYKNRPEQNIDILPSRTIPYRLMKPSNYDRRGCISNILRLNVKSLSRGDARQARQAQQAQRPSGHEEIRRQFPLTTTIGDSRQYKVSNYHSLASVVDFDSIVQIQALGSLISFLHSTCCYLVDNGMLHVNDIVVQKSTSNMYLSMETLSSLQIFATEHHPIAASKGHGNSKEGLSLFALLDRTKSRLGRQRLHEWMMKPLGELSEITRRQDGVELFSCFPEMKRHVTELVEYLFRVGAVDKLMLRIKKCCAKPSDFLLLSKALSSAVAIVNTLYEGVLKELKNVQNCLPLMGEYQPRIHDKIPNYIEFVESILERCFLDDLRDLFQRITDVIDEEKTFSTKEIIIRAGHHEQLDVCKIQFARLEGKFLFRTKVSLLIYTSNSGLYLVLSETLESVGADLVERMPHLRFCLNVIFLPQVRLKHPISLAIWKCVLTNFEGWIFGSP
jgi:MutS domain III